MGLRLCSAEALRAVGRVPPAGGRVQAARALSVLGVPARWNLSMLRAQVPRVSGCVACASFHALAYLA